VPAIGGHPERTWTPKGTFNPDNFGNTSRPSELKLALLKMAPMNIAYSTSPTAINTERAGIGRTEPAWITRGIRDRTKEVRALLYDHGEPEEGATLKILATRLLKNIEELRQIEKCSRPIFFVCHSTGGLVVKMALTEAKRSKNPILGDCYGITFFSTPHRGSSYLSRPDFSYSISEIMQLSAPLPESISSQLRLDHHLLKSLDSDFKSLATELQVWTFFETEDTNLTNEFHAPITSVKSALLNLRHEVVYPLLSDHAGCAAFEGNNSQTRESYLGELVEAIKKSIELNKIKHTEMNLEDRVKVEVNGFYEGALLASTNEVSMKIWSTSRTINDFKRSGPAKLLEERLAEINAPPKEKQYIRQNTRAPTLLPDKRTDLAPSAPPSSVFKTDIFNFAKGPRSASKNRRFRRDKSRDRGSREFKSPQHLAVPSASEDGPADKIPSIAVVAGDGLLRPDAPVNTFQATSSPPENALKLAPTARPRTPKVVDAFDDSDLAADGTHLTPDSQRRRASHGELSIESSSHLRPRTPQRNNSPSRRSREGSDNLVNNPVRILFSL
jgi:hypothetical protein